MHVSLSMFSLSHATAKKDTYGVNFILNLYLFIQL